MIFLKVTRLIYHALRFEIQKKKNGGTFANNENVYHLACKHIYQVSCHRKLSDPSKSLSATIWLLKRKVCPYLKKSKKTPPAFVSNVNKTNSKFSSTTQVTFGASQFSAIAIIFLKRNQ